MRLFVYLMMAAFLTLGSAVVFGERESSTEPTQPWGHEVVAVSAHGRGILDEAKKAIVANAQPPKVGLDQQGGPSFSYARWDFAGEGSNRWVVFPHNEPRHSMTAEEIARLEGWFEQVTPWACKARATPIYEGSDGGVYINKVIVHLHL